MEVCVKSNEVELVPFIHQVGGHSFMLSLDEETVCKSLIPRELQFYQTLPDGVEKFTPTFYGVVRVRTVLDAEGYIHFLTHPPPNFHAHSPAKARVRFKRSGSIELLASDGVFLEDSTSAALKTGLNPWVLKCHKQHIDELKHACLPPGEISNRESDKCLELNPEEEREFIVLENLVWKFKYPCILDLKMGTRQYGDSASLAKKQSKMVKVVSTTSAKLGLRVGGMQVYQKNSGKYLCRNKFYGRSLSVSGFQQALVEFLHNGVRFRDDVLSLLIRKLEELAAVLNKLEAFRFYTSSLLILYEGEDKWEDDEVVHPRLERENSGNFEGRRGSESNLSRKGSSSDAAVLHDQGSPSSLQGKRRTSSAANLESCTLSEASSNSSSNSNIFDDSCYQRKNRSDAFRGRTLSSKSDPGRRSGTCAGDEPKIDVRLIDFAHSTHKQLDDVVVYSGPDKGFLFGIDTLINMLKTIQCDYG